MAWNAFDFLDEAEPLTPTSAFDFLDEPEAEPPGRLGTAGSSLALGFGGIVSGMPKGLALMGAPEPELWRNYDRIDRGEQTTTRASKYAIEPDRTEKRLQQYQASTPEARKSLRGDFIAETETAQKSTLYEAGNQLDRWFAESFAVNPEFQQEWLASKLPQALGSAGGFVMAAVLGRGVLGKNFVGIYGVPSALGSVVNRADQFEQALDAGADIGTALSAADLGAVIGTTEAIPIGNLLTRLDKVSGGNIKRLLFRVVQQGTEEAVQEALAGVMNAAVSQQLYDPERGIWTAERVEEGAIGFTTGAILETLFSLALPGRLRGGGSRRKGKTTPKGETSTAAEVTTDAEERRRELNMKADQAELTPAERTELEFLRENSDNPTVIAAAYGVA
ncbi:hypothetical protein LCGC14_2746910, partial [marine sediment metagenome]